MSEQTDLFESARQRRIDQWNRAALRYPGAKRLMQFPPRSLSSELDLAVARLKDFINSKEGKAALNLIAAARITQVIASKYVVLEFVPGTDLPLNTRFTYYRLGPSGFSVYDTKVGTRTANEDDLREMLANLRSEIKPSKFVPLLRRGLNKFASSAA